MYRKQRPVFRLLFSVPNHTNELLGEGGVHRVGAQGGKENDFVVLTEWRERIEGKAF